MQACLFFHNYQQIFSIIHPRLSHGICTKNRAFAQNALICTVDLNLNFQIISPSSKTQPLIHCNRRLFWSIWFWEIPWSRYMSCCSYWRLPKVLCSPVLSFAQWGYSVDPAPLHISFLALSTSAVCLSIFSSIVITLLAILFFYNYKRNKLKIIKAPVFSRLIKLVIISYGKEQK